MAENHLNELIPSDMTEVIYTIRGKQVMLDRDLATIFNVQTRQINQQVNRNIDRFGEDYSFKLSKEEFRQLRDNLKSQNITSNWIDTLYPPKAFTMKGVLMLSGLLRSREASLINKIMIQNFVSITKSLNEYNELKKHFTLLQDEIHVLKSQMLNVDLKLKKNIVYMQEITQKKLIIQGLTQIVQEINKKQMDPGIIIAAISASMQAVDLWRSFRNKSTAKEALEQTENLQKLPSIQKEATQLGMLIRPDILESLERRIETCQDRYKKVLDAEKDYLPEEVDKATDALLQCICRELRRIEKINGEIPKGVLQDYWNKYNCYIE